jgi:hypothetical protein
LKKYISYGGGVGSTALICFLLDQIDNYEIVFMNHGGDWPETYDYVKYIQQELGINITVLNVDIEKKGSLYEYFWFYQMVPLYRYRICTDKAKIRPFNAYANIPCTVSFGITWDEKKRCWQNKEKEITNVYPLVDTRISRDTGIKLIRGAGLEVPMKSGCYFCPFQQRAQFKDLYDKHPGLFQKAVDLENRAMHRKPDIRLLPNEWPLWKLQLEFQQQTKLSEFEEVQTIA